MCTRPPSSALSPSQFHFLLTSPQAGVSPCSPAFFMAHTYAVVQKRRATSGPASESGACSTEGAPLYSHVTPGGRWPQAPTEEGAQLGGGELTGQGRAREGRTHLLGTATALARSAHYLTAVYLLVTTRSVPGQTSGPPLGVLLRKSSCLGRGLGPAPSSLLPQSHPHPLREPIREDWFPACSSY